jgi:hypothetical protein
MPFTGPFGLIYAVASFGYLLTQAEQLRCIINAARCLAPDGKLVIQTAVPGAELFDSRGKVSQVIDVPETQGTGAAVMLVCSQTDPVQQRLDQRVVVLGEDGTRIFTERRRYVWPSELDLMARIAGLRLQVRWGTGDANPMVRIVESRSRFTSRQTLLRPKSSYQNYCAAARRARPVLGIGMYPRTFRFLRAVRTHLTTARYVLLAALSRRSCLIATKKDGAS